ncbi:MAG: feruloyl-CoA synthase [Burkholderiaceae bacterium]|nr:feruloyl-CoA synthase [Burkholderiaceae bacterium]
MSDAPYRPIDFGVTAVDLRPMAGGAVHVTARTPLGSYPARNTDRLLHWADKTPGVSYMAKRGTDRAWRHLSYAQALGGARALGQALLERGLSAERPLLILSENDLENAQLALAAQYVGVAHAPVSTAYSLISRDFEKLRHIVRLTTPGLVFAASGARYGAAIRAAVPSDVEVVVTEAPMADRACTLFSTLRATAPTDAVEAAHARVGPDTIHRFLFTSGSTSLPKAVINTQRMLCSNQQMIAQCLPCLADEPPVLVDWLPWAHTFGGQHNTGIVLFNGGTLYIDDGKPVPGLVNETLANLREIAPTVYFNVPKGFEEIAAVLQADEAFAAHFFSRLKLLFYAGAGMAQPIWDSLHASAVRACGQRIAIATGLGMTETAPSAMFTQRLEVRSGHLGVPCPGVELKLAPSGDKTEVRYRGPSVTPGYWRSPDVTAASFDDEGFFHSGDAVKFLDEAHPELGFVFDGRIAEDFKLATGTWVSVGPMRARIAAAGAPYVQDAVLTGIDRDDLGALVFPHLESCRSLAPGLPADAPIEALLASPPVRAYFQRLVDLLMAQSTGSATRVMRLKLLAEPPVIDAGEITDKGSINQRAVLTRRAAIVRDLYELDDPLVIRPSAP